MPQSSTLTYLAGDRLGSTSLAVDASTGDVIQTRYKPWGEVRYTTPSKTLPTRYTFTGQYSYVSDDATDLGAAGFGLMFYNARWYDPALGRMVQADTIVPGGVQGLDRYAYVGNSPVNYVDPSGHTEIQQGDNSGSICTDPLTCPGFFLVGSPEDVQQVLDIVNAALEGTGYTTSADRYGRVSVTKTGDPTGEITPEQQAVIDNMLKYTSADVNFAIKVERKGIKGTFVDCFVCETLFLDDIQAIGDGPGLSSLIAIFHSFEEQYQRQVNGLDNDENDADYKAAHALAILVENAVSGATRGEDELHENWTVFTYTYPDGTIVRTLVVYDPFSVMICSPLRIVCSP